MRPQRRPHKRLGRRLEEVAKAVGGGYCRLQMPLRPALGVTGTVAGHRLGALGGGGGGGGMGEHQRTRCVIHIEHFSVFLLLHKCHQMTWTDAQKGYRPGGVRVWPMCLAAVTLACIRFSTGLPCPKATTWANSATSTPAAAWDMYMRRAAEGVCRRQTPEAPDAPCPLTHPHYPGPRGP